MSNYTNHYNNLLQDILKKILEQYLERPVNESDRERMTLYTSQSSPNIGVAIDGGAVGRIVVVDDKGFNIIMTFEPTDNPLGIQKL